MQSKKPEEKKCRVDPKSYVEELWGPCTGPFITYSMSERMCLKGEGVLKFAKSGWTLILKILKIEMYDDIDCQGSLQGPQP